MKWRVGTEAERWLERWLCSFRREKVVTNTCTRVNEVGWRGVEAG